MTGKKKGATFSYVNQLGYDKFEQRVYLEYGNGTKTTYTYEPDRRRLETMTAQTKAKRLFMDNVYGYDKVNNIKTLVNKAPIPSSNLMGGASTVLDPKRAPMNFDWKKCLIRMALVLLR